MQSSGVNQRFLTSLKSTTDVKDFNWCEYVLRCLRRTRKAWSGDEKHFSGPLGVLAV